MKYILLLLESVLYRHQSILTVYGMKEQSITLRVELQNKEKTLVM